MPTPSAASVFRRTSHLLLIGVGVFAGAFASAAAMKDIDAFYAPLRVEEGSLAPDGRHVAFTVRGSRGLEVQIFETDPPRTKVTVAFDRDRNATTRILNWISPDQLLAVSSTQAIMVTDPTGRLVRPVDITNLFLQSGGEVGGDLKRPEARIIQAPDDPACLLFESNVAVPVNEDSAGIPGRPRILELHRLNVLTGEVRRLMDYDVEKETPVGATLIDRSGSPRLVYRYGAEPPYFAYRDESGSRNGGSLLQRIFSDAGWRSFDRVLPDRSTFSFLLDPRNMLTQRTIPLGFDSDPNIFFFASNLHHDTLGIYAADLRTGKRTPLALEEAGTDLVDPDAPWTNSPLIYDRHQRTLIGLNLRTVQPSVRWLDAEIESAQRKLEAIFPERRVQLLGWDTGRERFLALIGSLGDPGRYFIFQRSDSRCVEFLRRAPSLPSSEINPTESFAFATPDGIRVTGYITLPRIRGKVLPPLVVSLHDGPWQRVEAGFDRDAQALATMGFAVVKINYRGSAGFGIAHREAIRTSLDRGPLSDVLATLSWIRNRYQVDLRRVGLIGEGYGGYLAMRGLQLHPEAFQSAVAINGLTTPLDLWSSLEPELSQVLPDFDPDAPPPKAAFKAPGVRQGPDPLRALSTWLVSRQSGLGSIAVTSDLKLLNKPLFLIHDPDNRAAPFLSITNLRASLRRQGRAPEYQKLTADFARADSPERGRVYRRIGEFFNLTLYDFKVKIGEAEEKK
ncbi:MAG: prolyl oligopeptidase family serine peptidase [Opitutaceae bacterium]